MKYYLDTEFDGWGGDLISMALVREDGKSLYMVDPFKKTPKDPWVALNVIPILYHVPDEVEIHSLESRAWGLLISDFLYGDKHPQIICDWPSDAVYISELLMTGPGESVPMGPQTSITILRHLNVYPSAVEGAIQHNAWWDAMAIRAVCQ